MSELNDIAELMEGVLGDSHVPRNIRAVVEDAKNKIVNEKDKKLAISSAIYKLEDISNDINMPAHTRTEIWMIISELEGMREKIK
ncbi:MAG: UPF0147 family protein [Candidatus Diapherotrites archaeon]